MKALLLTLLVLTVGAVIYPKFVKPRLENKIRDMESELQKRNQ